MKKILCVAFLVSVLGGILLPGCASTGRSSGTSFGDYFSAPTVNRYGIAFTVYSKQIEPGDMETLSVVLLSGYTYIEQKLNHYGYMGVAVQFTSQNKRLYIVERTVFDQFLKSEIDSTTFVSRLTVMDL